MVFTVQDFKSTFDHFCSIMYESVKMILKWFLKFLYRRWNTPSNQIFKTVMKDTKRHTHKKKTYGLKTGKTMQFQKTTFLLDIFLKRLETLFLLLPH